MIYPKTEYRAHKFDVMSGDEIRITITSDDDIQEKVDLLKNLINDTNNKTLEWRKILEEAEEREKQRELQQGQNAQLIKDKLKGIKL